MSRCRDTTPIAPDVRETLGVSLDTLVDPAFGGKSLTRTIGDTAASMGIDILIVPSARDAGANVVILNPDAVKNTRFAGTLDL